MVLKKLYWFQNQVSFYIHNKSILSCCGGIIFVSIFLLAYSFIDDKLYLYRDDGIISMSVGKNLVDYGFLGVSPSGPIVEASSSPIQMFLYALLYGLTGIGYKAFSLLQTIITTFFIGWIFIRFFVNKPIQALLISFFSAIVLTFAYPFFLWHASGMENALTHLLFLITIYILYQAVINKNINYFMCVFVFLATIVRLDSVYHIGILLVVFSIYWYVLYSNFKALKFSLLVMLLWMAFNLWRYLYFGDIRPNTAYAQNISVINNINHWFNIDKVMRNLEISDTIFMKNMGWICLFFIPFAITIRKDKKAFCLVILIATLLITTLFHPFLFGPTRIERVRTNTQLTLMIFLFITMVYFHVKYRKKTLYLLTIIPVIVTIYIVLDIKPYYLGWNSENMKRRTLTYTKMASHHNIMRPTISSPDLGITSWYKRFNIIDLGFLGSPIMAKTKTNRKHLSQYYLSYGLPDIIASRGSWSRLYCHKSNIFNMPKFYELYQSNIPFSCMEEKKNKKSTIVYWIRKDIMRNSNSAERKLLDDLQTHFNIERIKKEIDICTSNNRPCHYIARTVYKFIPELRKNNIFDNVYALFTSDVDKALLEGWRNPQAHQKIIQKVIQETNTKNVKVHSAY